MARPNAPLIDFGSLVDLGAMEKAPKSQSEIEDLLMLDLRSFSGCEKAERIMVVQIADPYEPANWTVSRFDPGRSDAGACDLALQQIVPRLQRVYELVQKH